jgi:hypothetical protein
MGEIARGTQRAWCRFYGAFLLGLIAMTIRQVSLIRTGT